MRKILLFNPFLLFFYISCAQTGVTSHPSVNNASKIIPAEKTLPVGEKIIPAAERLDLYLPLLKDKRVAIFANPTSMVGNVHLVDTLLSRSVNIKKIFAPEHGFRGTADAGEHVSNAVDPGSGLPVISLYGNKRKPSADDVKDIDVILFDIQDVGARFFTYISSLQDLIEATIKLNKQLIILDRPNPNGFYVDGPVLKRPFKSFLGMQQVPVVYGMTIGEYGMMLIGEKWIDSSLHTFLGASSPKVKISVIPCDNYTHSSKYQLPIKSSPNLPDMASVYLYPSTCFFEGTALSEGRGTNRAFQVFGHPLLPKTMYSFTPRSIPGAKSPKLLNQLCYGWDLGGPSEDVLKKTDGKIQLKWLLEAYSLFPGKDSFFINSGANFNRLAGNDLLISQVKKGISEENIRQSWQEDLVNFKKIRRKYLLYKDFE
ncbi:MAG: DUF1343 domain-containing protein [Flavitalea sp.]